MQKDKIRITNPEAAKTLRSSAILPYFLEQENPSAVAKKLGTTANLVHHHAKKALELGLLFEARREKGKIYYQLTAKTFAHARDLLPLEHKIAADVLQLTDVFVQAYAKSDANVDAGDADYDFYGFAAKHDELPPMTAGKPIAEEKHPAHFQTLTIKMNSQRYRQLVNDIWRLLEAAQTEKTTDSSSCTFSILAFDGVLREGHEDSMHIDSFVQRTEQAT